MSSALSVYKLPSFKTFRFADGRLTVSIVKCQTERTTELFARPGNEMTRREAAWLILAREFGQQTADERAECFYLEMLMQLPERWRVTSIQVRLFMRGKQLCSKAREL